MLNKGYTGVWGVWEWILAISGLFNLPYNGIIPEYRQTANLVRMQRQKGSVGAPLIAQLTLPGYLARSQFRDCLACFAVNFLFLFILFNYLFISISNFVAFICFLILFYFNIYLFTLARVRAFFKTFYLFCFYFSVN